jgi:hypothetical protein
MKCTSAAHGCSRCPARDWWTAGAVCPETEHECVLFGSRTRINLGCGRLCGDRLGLGARPITRVIHHFPYMLEPPIGAFRAAWASASPSQPLLVLKSQFHLTTEHSYLPSRLEIGQAVKN